MALPKNIVLVRHGQSEGNVAFGRSRNRDDSDFTEEFRQRPSALWRLTDKGKSQAIIAGEWIKSNFSDNFQRLYASEYLRAMETAALLKLKSEPWYLDFYLRERDQGLFESMPISERLKYYPEDVRRLRDDPFIARPPGGESLAEIRYRVDRIIETLHRECEGENVIIVCHGEIMWVFVVVLERMSRARFLELHHSKNSHDMIHNGQVIIYSRVNPYSSSGEMGPYANWKFSVCPNNSHLSPNQWEEIRRPIYNNETLLAEVEKTKRLING